MPAGTASSKPRPNPCGRLGIGPRSGSLNREGVGRCVVDEFGIIEGWTAPDWDRAAHPCGSGTPARLGLRAPDLAQQGIATVEWGSYLTGLRRKGGIVKQDSLL